MFSSKRDGQANDYRFEDNFKFLFHARKVCYKSFSGVSPDPQSNLWTTPKTGFVRDEMNKHYELNRGVRRLLTRYGLHKFHWSWWGWFNFSCTKRERTNDWARRTRGFVMERECKKYFFQDVRKKWKFWHQCSTIFNSCVVKASYRVQRWTGQFCDHVIKHRLELYKSISRQHTFYRNWSLWDRGLIYCIYYWKEESARKRVLAFPFACRQIDQICDSSRGGWFLFMWVSISHYNLFDNLP